MSIFEIWLHFPDVWENCELRELIQYFARTHYIARPTHNTPTETLHTKSNLDDCNSEKWFWFFVHPKKMRTSFTVKRRLHDGMFYFEFFFVDVFIITYEQQQRVNSYRLCLNKLKMSSGVIPVYTRRIDRGFWNVGEPKTTITSLKKNLMWFF